MQSHSFVLQLTRPDQCSEVALRCAALPVQFYGDRKELNILNMSFKLHLMIYVPGCSSRLCATVDVNRTG